MRAENNSGLRCAVRILRRGVLQKWRWRCGGAEAGRVEAEGREVAGEEGRAAEERGG